MQAEQPKQPSAPRAELVIHALIYGSTLCRKPGVPSEWEPNHRWIMAKYCDPTEISCVECRSAYDASMRAQMPGWRSDDPRLKTPVPKLHTKDML